MTVSFITQLIVSFGKGAPSEAILFVRPHMVCYYFKQTSIMVPKGREQMKTLVLVAHPNLNESNVNRAWVERLSKEEGVYVHDLYQEYPDFKINVEKEQALAEQYDRIVFQFPLYWYSTPAILKEWQDVVLTYGWAYGSEGTKLQGKEFMAAVSTGSPAEAYGENGRNHYPMTELLRPLQAMTNLTGMTFVEPFLLQGVNALDPNDLAVSAEEYVKRIKA